MIDRLEGMLKYQEEKNLPGTIAETVTAVEGEELELEDMEMLEVGALEFPKNLITLSLMNNRLENAEELINKLQYLNLRVLWLNGNPVASNSDLRTYVENKTRIEMFNSKFTKNTGDWGIKFAHSKKIKYANEVDKQSIYVLNLDNRNIYEVDPTVLEGFTNLRSLSIKDHPTETAEDFAKLLRIISIPTLNFLYVDEAVEIKLREASKKG